MFPNNPTKYQYLLVLTMLFVSTPILACGWWGDGEQSSQLENLLIDLKQTWLVSNE